MNADFAIVKSNRSELCTCEHSRSRSTKNIPAILLRITYCVLRIAYCVLRIAYCTGMINKIIKIE